MLPIDALEAEFETAITNFKQMKSFSNTILEQSSLYLSMTENIANVLKPYGESLTLLIFNGISSFLPHGAYQIPTAPGLPGFQEFHYTFLSNCVDLISHELSQIEKSIRKNITPAIEQGSLGISSIIAVETVKIDAATGMRQAEKAKLLSSFQVFEKAQSKALKYPNAENVEAYFSCLNSLQLRIQSFNFAHVQSIHQISASCDVIKDSHSERLKSIYSSVAAYISGLKETVLCYCSLYKQISLSHQDWGSGFIAFIEGHAICRTAMSRTEFKPFCFCFKDPSLGFRPINGRSVDNSEPILTAIVTRDFSGNGKNELSVKNGEEIGLLEPAVGQWTLARKGMHIGFVPSNSIKVQRNRLAVVAISALKYSDQSLSVYDGEVVKVLERQTKETKCEDLSGEKGLAASSLLVFE